MNARNAKPTDNRPLSLVVMAAGIGSRYGGLKQMDSIGPGGEIIIDYSVFDAIRAGFSRVVLVIRKDIEKVFREKIGRTIEKQVDTRYTFQELADLPAGFAPPAGRTKPWGTAQAVLCARDVTPGAFGVINADDFYGAGAFATLASSTRALTSDRVLEASSIAYVIDNTLSEHGHVARGICAVDGSGLLTEIVERKKVQRFPDGVKFTEDGQTWQPIAPGALVSMNMWGFPADAFDLLDDKFNVFLQSHGADATAECLLPGVVGELVREKRAAVKVLRTEERWFGVTYREDKPLVEKAIRDLVAKGAYPAKLWTGA